MTSKEFMKKVAHEKKDLLQEFIDTLHKRRVSFCVIGGLAVNAYAEPVVSLDLDVVVIVDKLAEVVALLEKKYRVKKYKNSINISSPFSDLRLQIQTDPRYQGFIGRAVDKKVLGYQLPVAAIEDVFKAKTWAAQDETRRLSKRQKDLADILRLLEAKKGLISLLPRSLIKKLGIQGAADGVQRTGE